MIEIKFGLLSISLALFFVGIELMLLRRAVEAALKDRE